jgi:ribonuclease P protein subunit RPR2
MKRWKEAERDIARERIEILLDLAKKTVKKDSRLTRRYVELAKKIGMRAQVRMQREDKHMICKGCGILLVPGFNCRVRTRPDAGTRVVITCLDCGRHRRYPALREKKGAQ